MAAFSLTPRRFTADEYLMVERAADYRSEMLDGEIYAMSGGSLSHTRICDNVTVEVGIQLKGKRCQGLSQNMKVPAGRGRLYSYPDYVILCEEPKFRDDEKDVLLNPQVLFEVLSPTTAYYDRTMKFDLYKQIATLREYVLIDQDKPRAEHFVLTVDGDWVQRVVTGLDAVLALDTVAVSISLRDLYDRIEFEDRVLKERGGDYDPQG